MAHLIARLLDSYYSYKEADQRNHNLEEMIEDRTKARSKANRCLAELSVRDALIQAYNMPHFEVMIEKALSEYQENIPGEEIDLCIISYRGDTKAAGAECRGESDTYYGEFWPCQVFWRSFLQGVSAHG